MSLAPDKLASLLAEPAYLRQCTDDLQFAWAAACGEARAAYRAWSAAPTEGKRDSYAVYLAAAERESAAARVLEHSRADGRAGRSASISARTRP